MDAIRADTIAARAHLAAQGWVPRNSESFRHLPPPQAREWLGAALEIDDADFASAWVLGRAGADVDATWLDAIDPAQRAELLRGLPPPADHGEAAPFAWAHRALVRDGLRLRVARTSRPAVLRVARIAPVAVEAPLLVIELEPHARCTLVETHAAGATQNLQVHVRAAEGAQLDHVRIVHAQARSQLAHHVHVAVDAGARYAQRLLATGAAYHLQRAVLDLHGHAGAASVRGVLLAADGTVLEQQVRARHAAPSTQSNVEMLALGRGAAHVVANAFTAIDAGCSGADVRQRLKGIPTGGQPKLVLRPHLEIHHDDVQAVHGATWGALPDDALFHARQRGLGEDVAKAMIVEGLARAMLTREADVPEELEAALADAVRNHLAPAKESCHG